MSISTEILVKNWLSNVSRKCKSISYTYIDNKLYMGRIELAKKHDRVLLINNGIDENLAIKELIKQAEYYNYKVILVPMKYGEEIIPDIETVRSRLNEKLKYYNKFPTELIQAEIRAEFENVYNMYNTLVKEAFKGNRVYYKYTKLYNNVNKQEYIKELKRKTMYMRGYQK